MSQLKTQTIPTVNLKDFLSDSRSSKNNFIDSVGKALNDCGFFALEGHGVDAGLIGDAYGVAEQFFLLPEAEKKKYEIKGFKGQRGYISFGREHAKDYAAPDLKEHWHVGRDLSEGHKDYNHYPKNVWPSEVPAFRAVFQKLYAQLETCAMSLLDACSVYIGEEESFLRNCTVDGNTVLRVIHYPPISQDRNPQSVRAAAHEDINFITLLCESTAEGLELLQRDGTWLPIKSIKGQIVVDTGDMIQNLTNGLLKSTTHRVVNPDNDRDRRFSMPFFVHPRSEVSLNPLTSCIAKTGGQVKYPNISADDYLQQRLREIGLTY